VTAPVSGPSQATSLPELRPALSSDVEAIAVLWHSGWRDAHLGHVPSSLLEHRHLEGFRLRVPERIPTTIVATLGSQLVGFVTVHDDEIEQLYVAASARGSAVAAALLARGEQVIGTRFERAWLGVVAGNARARRFYAKQGWQQARAFDYGAQIAGGTIAVPCLRYEKHLTREAQLSRTDE
jgi:GNAT superfamily N-acetyltransferase